MTGQDAGVLQHRQRHHTPTGASDGNPITFAVTDTSGTTAVPAGMTGEIGGVTDLLTTTLPAYVAGLGAVAKQLADEINAQHQAGYDAAGNPGQAFFGYNPADPAGTLSVALTAPGELAASSLPGGVLDAGNATALASATGAEDAYQRLVNGFGTEVASVQPARRQPAGPDQPGGRLARAAVRASASTRRWSRCCPPNAPTRRPRG